MLALAHLRRVVLRDLGAMDSAFGRGEEKGVPKYGRALPPHLPVLQHRPRLVDVDVESGVFDELVGRIEPAEAAHLGEDHRRGRFADAGDGRDLRAELVDQRRRLGVDRGCSRVYGIAFGEQLAELGLLVGERRPDRPFGEFPQPVEPHERKGSLRHRPEPFRRRGLHRGH